MISINEFYANLEKHRKPPSDDPFDRLTHCFLEHEHEGNPHFFEVRSWKTPENGYLWINVVNWTLLAGTASLRLSNDEVAGWIILDSNEYYKRKLEV